MNALLAALLMTAVTVDPTICQKSAFHTSATAVGQKIRAVEDWDILCRAFLEMQAALLMPEPTLSLPAGSYASGTVVTVTGAVNPSMIYYTTDGTIPTVASTACASPCQITLNSPITLKAIAGAEAKVPSLVATATYATTGSYATTTTLTTSFSTVVVTAPVTLRVVVTSSGQSPPTSGTVTFFDGSTIIGASTLNGSSVAVFTISTLSAGSHALTAQYGGVSNYSSSTSLPVTQVITAQMSAPSVALFSSANPSQSGSPVTFTLTVTCLYDGCPTPTGTAGFYDNGAALGEPSLSAGSAVLTTSSLSAGSHPINTIYWGDSNYNGQTSSVVTQVVQQSGTVSGVRITSPTAPITVNGGATQTFVAVVDGSGGPSQTVTWSATAGSWAGSVWSAPAATTGAQTVTITATSVQDNSKNGTATVTVPGSADTTKPVVQSFSLGTVSGLSVPVTISATDDTGVTGYGVSLSSTPPAASALTSSTGTFTYTGTTAGSVTLFAWARDAVGNVSNLYGTSLTVTLVDPVYTTYFGYPSTNAPPSVTSFSAVGGHYLPTGEASTTYLLVQKATAPANGNATTLSFYANPGATGNWGSQAVRPLLYQDNGSGAPGALVGVGPEVIAHANWNDLAIAGSPAIAAGTVYWFGLWSATNTAMSALVMNNGAGGNSVYRAVTYTSSGSPPDPFGATTDEGAQFPMFVTYTTTTPTVSTPTFSPDGGTAPSFTVAISDNTSNSIILWCDTGSNCTPGTTYTGTIAVTTTKTICAKATRSSYNPSATACRTFTINPVTLNYPTDVPYASLAPMPTMAVPPAAHATAGAVDNASTFTGFADSMRVVMINSTSVHHYMKDNPWSADGKFLKLHSGGAILDATTLQPLGSVSQCSNSSRQWSMVTPNVVWSTSQAGYLCKTTVASDGSGGTLNSTFQQLPAGIGYVLGGFQGAIDDGDHYAPLLAGDEPSLLPLVIWDIQNATTKCTISNGHTGIYNAGMSHDGAYVTLMGTGSAGSGLFAYRISDCARTAGPFSALDTEGRYDACVNQDGEQVTVWTGGTGSHQTNTIYMTRLSDGLTTAVLHDPSGPLAGYISCRNSKRPGWAYFSPQLTTANANVVGADAWQRIMAIKLEDTANSSNGNGTVENFAWAHIFPLCNGGAAIGDLFCYGGEPAAVPSFDGTRVLWKGYWDADGTGSVATGTSVPLRAYVAWKDATLPAPVVTYTYPANTTFASAGTQETASEPGLYSTSFTNAFGNKVTRVANAGHAYAKDSVWNADASLAMTNDGTLIDGTTFQPIGKTINGYRPNEHRVWSNVNPNYVYGLNIASGNNQWRRVDVSTTPPTQTNLGTAFTESTVSFGDYEGSIDNLDHWAVLDVNGNKAYLINVANGSKVCEATVPGSIADSTVSQDGKFFFTHGSDGTRVYTTPDGGTGCAFQRFFPTAGNGHWDACVADDGVTQVIAIIDDSVSGSPVPPRIYNVATGALIGSHGTNGGGFGYWSSSPAPSYQIHVSCRNIKRPGWAYISYFRKGTAWDSYSDAQRIFAMKLDGSNTVEDFAWAHAADNTAFAGSWGGADGPDPEACPSPYGERVWWKTGWGSNSADVHSYVAWKEATQTACNTYTYSAWGTCTNGTQSHTVTGQSPSGCTDITTNPPSLTQSCGGTLAGTSWTGSTSLTAYPKTGSVTTCTAPACVVVSIDQADSSNGSASTPLARLNYALGLLGSTVNTVLLRAVNGTATQTTTVAVTSPITRTSTSTANLVTEGDGTGYRRVFAYGTQRVKLDASGWNSTGEAEGPLRLNGTNEHWKGFEVSGVPGATLDPSGNYVHGIVNVRGDHNKIEDFLVHDNGGGVAVATDGGSNTTSTYNVVQDCIAWNNGGLLSAGTQHQPNGFESTGVGNAFVRNAVFNARDDGFDMWCVVNPILLDNVAYGPDYQPDYTTLGTTAGTGIKMGLASCNGTNVGSGGGTVRGNLVVNYGNVGIGNADLGSATVANSTYDHNTAIIGTNNVSFIFKSGDTATSNVWNNGSSGSYTGSNNSTSGNTWAAASQGDFSLASGSSAIGGGAGGSNAGASSEALQLLKDNWCHRDNSCPAPVTLTFPADINWSTYAAFSVNEPTLSMPGLRATPVAFGNGLETSVTRASNKLQHYPINSVWNIDESRAIVRRVDGVWSTNVTFQLNGQFPYTEIGDLDYNQTPFFDGYRMWSNVYPNYLYGLSESTLQWLRVDVTGNSGAGTVTVPKGRAYIASDFGLSAGQLSTVSMDTHSAMATDDSAAALAINGASASTFRVAVIDPASGDIKCIAHTGGQFGTGINNGAIVSQDGKYLVVTWKSPTGLASYNITSAGGDCTFQTTLLNNGNHADLCVNQAGEQVYVETASGGNSESITMTRLSDNVTTTVWGPDNRYVDTHVSCRNVLRPGYAYVSQSNSTCSGSSPAYQGALVYNKFIAVKLSPQATATAEIFAWLHQPCSTAGGSNGDGAAFGVPSPTGTRVWWKTNWLENGTNTIYSFVAGKP